MEAERIEVGLCDAVHFRLVETRLVFELIEKHLRKRNSGHFKGFASVREKVEREKRGASLREKVEACCIEHHEWFLEKQVLYSSELEVWMDLSYANPWILELYHEALYQGKALYISRVGPFTPLFIKLLLRKNGYERIAEEPDPSKTVQVILGQNGELKPGQVLFNPVGGREPCHALADDPSLSSQLANGNMCKSEEELLLRKPEGKGRYLHELGYRLIGPTLWLMMQRLGEEERPVGFTGPGSEYLTSLARSIQQRWSLVPEVVIEEKAAVVASLFPGAKSAFSLLPMDKCELCPPIIPLELCQPQSLFLEPLEHFFLAMLGGDQAAEVQAAATAFVEEFALITRGLRVQLPLEPIIREWQHFILSPSHECLHAILTSRIVPGFNSPHNPWQASRQVMRGPWPTGSYLLTNSLERWWLQMTHSDRKRSIGEWVERLENPVREPLESSH
ncbi:hypothetical protein G0Q06_06970 [Puniceicoccales bacterium CK1056]|uniref:Uncharacterized protein n=1 Tax=Oceanipulchritudo coccoides TaxID=2706888 RepID=A0A6B2M217_9BACT|nr:hypothetical protein [Oceanipulchritudo coccoides]